MMLFRTFTGRRSTPPLPGPDVPRLRVPCSSVTQLTLAAVFPVFLVGGLLLTQCGEPAALQPTSPTTPERQPSATDDASVAPTTRPPVSSAPSRWEVLDRAAADLLNDLPTALEEMVVAGESKASITASFVPNLLAEWERLTGAAQAAYLLERTGTGSPVTLAVPCNECSDNYTDCIADAVDNLVECLSGCPTFRGGKDCRNGCKATWRDERNQCKETNRECRKRCTPKARPPRQGL